MLRLQGGAGYFSVKFIFQTKNRGNVMQKYEEIKKLSADRFKRLTGVQPGTFKALLEVLKEEEVKRRKKGGKPSRLSIEDMLLMSLEYLREYCTYFHLIQSYGLSESSCHRICVWVENSLIRSGKFSLPG